jgi:hypothetical protein
MMISTTCLAFEVTRKRRRGLSVRNARAPRRSHRPRRQGADRETRAQRSVPVRLRQKLSKNAACAPVASTAANGSITCAIKVLFVARMEGSEVRGVCDTGSPYFRTALRFIRATLVAEPSETVPLRWLVRPKMQFRVGDRRYHLSRHRSYSWRTHFSRMIPIESDHPSPLRGW